MAGGIRIYGAQLDMLAKDRAGNWIGSLYMNKGFVSRISYIQQRKRVLLERQQGGQKGYRVTGAESNKAVAVECRVGSGRVEAPQTEVKFVVG